jgi:hypothetical protein
MVVEFELRFEAVAKGNAAHMQGPVLPPAGDVS